MITALFVLLMISVFGRLIIFAIKAAWGISKVLFAIVFCPIVLIVIALSSGIIVALPILIIIGIVSLVKKSA